MLPYENRVTDYSASLVINYVAAKSITTIRLILPWVGPCSSASAEAHGCRRRSASVRPFPFAHGLFQVGVADYNEIVKRHLLVLCLVATNDR